MFDFDWNLLGDDALYRWFAWVGTALFVGKMLLSLIAGAIGGDAEFDSDADLDVSGADIEHDSGAAFTIISLQGLLAFLMAMGWMGLACLNEWGFGPGWTLVISTSFGFSLMLLNGFLMYQVKRLNAAGRYDLDSAVGRVGRVYLSIPARGEGRGQIEVVVSGRRKIIPAASNGPAIPSFREVRVLGMRDAETVLVESEGGPEPTPADEATTPAAPEQADAQSGPAEGR